MPLAAGASFFDQRLGPTDERSHLRRVGGAQLRYVKYKVVKADQFRAWRHVCFSARVPAIGFKLGSWAMGP